MNEEVKKLDDMIENLNNFMIAISKNYRNKLTREVLFSGMVIKKTIDILETSKYVLRNYLITVQTSLLRLLCDNCLAIQSVKELDLKTVMDMIENKQQVNQVMVDDEQNMSDGYLKRKVSESYQGFDRLYKFASQGVHFSNQTLASILSYDKDNNIKLNVSVGNKELKEEVINNNERMITLTKIIIRMIKEIILI